MTDEEKLRKKIRDSGFRIAFVAEKCGMSYQALLNKMRNDTEFVASEIKALRNLLGIDEVEAEDIFFADNVGKTPTANS